MPYFDRLRGPTASQGRSSAAAQFRLYSMECASWLAHACAAPIGYLSHVASPDWIISGTVRELHGTDSLIGAQHIVEPRPWLSKHRDALHQLASTIDHARLDALSNAAEAAELAP